ncbi:MAG: glycosyltransferase, partial [Candidatus Gastranaerophilaceae bacterium]
NISNKLISYYLENQESIIYPDQDPINAVLDNRILELDYKYNWCWHWDKNEYFEEHGVTNINDAVIIHYIFNKPWWSSNIHIASKKYFDTIKSIPKNIRKNYSSFKEKKLVYKKSLYLFCLLPLFKISNYYTTEYWKIFSIPFLKVKRSMNTSKYYLFNLIPVFKINQTGMLEKHLKFVKALGKY